MRGAELVRHSLENCDTEKFENSEMKKRLHIEREGSVTIHTLQWKQEQKSMLLCKTELNTRTEKVYTSPLTSFGQNNASKLSWKILPWKSMQVVEVRKKPQLGTHFVLYATALSRLAFVPSLFAFAETSFTTLDTRDTHTVHCFYTFLWYFITQQWR